MPHLQQINEQYSDEKVQILSLNAINPAQQVAAEAKKNGVRAEVLVCRGSGVLGDYEVKKLPHIFIIDQKGVIRASSVFMKLEDIQKTLDELLAAPAAP